MKKLNVLFATIAAALVATSAMAQAPQNGPTGARKHETIEQRVNHMAKALNLTERQEKDILTLLRDQKKQAKLIHGNTSLAPDVKKARMQQLRKDSKNAIEAILTKEQLAKFKAMHHHKPTSGATGVIRP